jgi:hypothetical protein
VKSRVYNPHASKHDRVSTSADNEDSYIESSDGKIRQKPNEVSVLQRNQSDPYSHEYNSQPADEEKNGCNDGYNNGILTFNTSTSSQNNSDYYRQQASDVVKSIPAVTSTQKSTKRSKKNQPYFQSNTNRNEKQAEAVNDKGFVAGMSTSAKINQPYNFSYGYGDGDQEEPEARRSNIDTGFVAGMSTAAKINQPYNFSYGYSDGDQEEPKARRSNIDTGFVAGMSTAAKINQPYNFSYGYGDGDQEEPEARRSNIDTGFVAGMSTAAKISEPYNFAYGKCRHKYQALLATFPLNFFFRAD